MKDREKKMTGSIDIFLEYLTNSDEPSKQNLTRYHIAQKPRHPGRGRKNDGLFLSMSLEGNAPLSAERQEKLLAKLAQIYYQTPGSVTAALRTVARALNQYLFDRNQKGTSSGQQASASLNQIVIRESRLYIAQSGNVVAYLIRPTGTQVISDPQIAGKGLGFSRVAPIYYFQNDIKSDDYLIITQGTTTNLDPEQLTKDYSKDPSQFTQQLASININAVVMRARQGTGKTSRLASQPARKEKPQTVFIGEVTTQSAKVSPSPQSSQEGFSQPAAENQPVDHPSTKPQTEDTLKTHKKASRSFSPQMAKMGTQAMHTVNKTISKIILSSKTMLNRLLPGDALSGLPSSVMLIVALVVPILVVSIASAIYFRSGRTNQYLAFYEQAQQLFSQAQSLTDPNLQRLAWQNTLANLDQAENYQTSGDTLNLRTQTLQKLDELDGIKRLDLQPALTISFPAGTQVNQIAASGNELFLLNATQGNIIRTVYTTSGYDEDNSFHCGPDETGAGNTGALIDFFILPEASQLNATVYAMDIGGNFIECAAGKEPKISQLTPAPTGMGTLRGFTMDAGNLYVLDPGKNAVWIYWKGNVEKEPELFFSETVPDLSEVIDFAVSETDLYLLHADGHMALCTYSNWGGAPTRCSDPANYIDLRKGKENQNLKTENPFTSIFASSPPDPSLYLFDPKTPAIYHFSLRQLTYHRQYQPSSESASIFSETPASAFTINVDTRMFYIARGLQVFFANIP
jgi:hypothetical protein